jgi:Na+(H+)/acetate symporter ActP
VELRFPRRARLARAMLRGIAGLLWGLVTGLVGTFLLLFVWPNDAQNGRLDAVKWVGFYWYNHGIFLIPMAWMVGAISGWLWQREAAQKLANPPEGTW